MFGGETMDTEMASIICDGPDGMIHAAEGSVLKFIFHLLQNTSTIVASAEIPRLENLHHIMIYRVVRLL